MGYHETGTNSSNANVTCSVWLRDLNSQRMLLRLDYQMDSLIYLDIIITDSRPINLVPLHCGK